MPRPVADPPTDCMQLIVIGPDAAPAVRARTAVPAAESDPDAVPPRKTPFVTVQA